MAITFFISEVIMPCLNIIYVYSIFSAEFVYIPA